MSKIWGPVQTSQEVSDDLENHTRFVWDGSHLLQEVHPDGRYTYLYADQDSYEPLAQVRDWTTADGENCQQTRYFHCDQIGIPREMTDKDGNLLWFGNYTGWGRLKEEIKVTDSAYQPFRLQNQYADPETGLHYNFFRYYESDAGRFVNQDPIGLWGGSNSYQFAPNTLKWTDTWGLLPKCSDAKRAECDKQAEIDEATCRQIPEKDKARRSRCWASVQERYGACISNRPMPPLVTYKESHWNEYIVPILIGTGVVAFCVLGGEGVCALSAIGGTFATQ